jgi:hypothetical protein
VSLSFLCIKRQKSTNVTECLTIFSWRVRTLKLTEEIQSFMPHKASVTTREKETLTILYQGTCWQESGGRWGRRATLLRNEGHICAWPCWARQHSNCTESLSKLTTTTQKVLRRQRKKSGDTQLYIHHPMGHTSISKAVPQFPVKCMHVIEAPKNIKIDIESHLFLAT